MQMGVEGRLESSTQEAQTLKNIMSKNLSVTLGSSLTMDGNIINPL